MCASTIISASAWKRCSLVTEGARHLESPGLWVDIAILASAEPTPALFLDRDGTVIVDTGYPRKPADVTLLPGLLPAVRTANRLGVPVVVVSNQSGIARGLLTWDDFAQVDARMKSLLGAAGCIVDATLACAYFPSSDPALDVPDHPMRKPNPGMLQLAAERLNLDLGNSLIVGDRPTDLAAGASAGLSQGFLVGPETPERLPGTMPCSRVAGAGDWERLAAAITACARTR